MEYWNYFISLLSISVSIAIGILIIGIPIQILIKWIMNKED